MGLRPAITPTAMPATTSSITTKTRSQTIIGISIGPSMGLDQY